MSHINGVKESSSKSGDSELKASAPDDRPPEAVRDRPEHLSWLLANVANLCLAISFDQKWADGDFENACRKV